jgi:hypothetical protein
MLAIGGWKDTHHMNSLPLNPSEAFKRLNIHLYPGAVGAVEVSQRKPDPLSSLDSRRPPCQSSPQSMVIGIVGVRHKLLDGDNFIGGCKPLRDSIAASIGIDDGSLSLTWEYSQILTRGPEGTIVVISAT